MWHDLLEAQQAGLSVQLPASDLAAAMLRVLLLAQQYHLAVQLLPMYAQQQPQGRSYLGGPSSSRGGTPTAGEAAAMPLGGAFAEALEASGLSSSSSQRQQAAAYDLFASRSAAEAAAQAEADRGPASAEAALAALTGGTGSGGSALGGVGGGGSRFGVRRALHKAAGVAVSSAVSSSAKVMGVSAHLVGSTAHLVGSTAAAVQSGTGGMMGATAGLVSGTASFVSSAATFAAEAAAKAGSSKAGLPGISSSAARSGGGGSIASRGSTLLRGAAGLLDAAAAEAVVVDVSKELLGSATSLEDPAVAAAEAVLHLLPDNCKVHSNCGRGDLDEHARRPVLALPQAAVCGGSPHKHFNPLMCVLPA